MGQKIRYSMCWEDPKVVVSALDISKSDSIISIASGGENVFAILLKGPKRLVAIDSNPDQLYLTRLKAAAIKELTFTQFVEFLGFKQSLRRKEYYKLCKKHLSEKEIQFWDANINLIQKGVIGCGKFESYLNIFRKWVLSFVLSRKDIDFYLSLNNKHKQRQFYRKKWNNFVWKLLFRILFSKTVMQIVGRDKKYFKYEKNVNVGRHFYLKAEYGITSIPAKSNFFMHMVLIGTIPVPFNDHPYLNKENFQRLKKLIKRVEYVSSDIVSYLKKQKPNSFSKYNLSDIFEPLSQEEYENAIIEIDRTSKKNARMCYWNNLVQRNLHPSSKGFIQDKKESKKLESIDRVFFYSRFVVEKKSA